MWVGVLLISFIKLLMTFPVVVDGGSMIPTLYSDEVIYVNAFDVKFSDINRGDIVVFTMPGVGAEDYYYLKRVIGVSGDEVVVKEGKIYLNGELLSEPYLRPGETTQIPDVAGGFLVGGVTMTSDGKGFVYNVPVGKYFVLGDNRENSIDSRSFVDVYVSGKDIKGKFTI